MRILFKHTVTAAGFLAAIGCAAAAQSGESIATRSADVAERVPGRAGAEMYWMQRADVGVPPLVQRTYANTRKVLANPITTGDPAHYGRAGGYAGLDKMRALDGHAGARLASPDAS